MVPANNPQSIWLARILDHSEVLDGLDDWITKRITNPATWWQNPTNPNSLRLSRMAWLMLEKAPRDLFNFVKFELPDAILPKTLVQLERHFTAPYYIKGQKTLYCCGETEILMLSLHGNNLQQYLDNYSR